MKREVLELERKVVTVPLCLYCMRHAEEAASILADRLFMTDFKAAEAVTVRFYRSTQARCVCEIEIEGESCAHRATISLFAKLAQTQVSTLRRAIDDLFSVVGRGEMCQAAEKKS